MRRDPEKYTPIQKGLDFLGTIAAGVWIGAVYAISRNSGEPDHPDVRRCYMLAICSFALAGALYLLPRKKLAFGIPSWLVVLAAGSFFSFVSIVWFDKEVWLTYGTLANYLIADPVEKGLGLLLNVFVDVALALPIAALLHYFPNLFEIAKNKISHR